MDLDIAGRTALVTGADSGIGRATVTTLLAEGATVVATATSRDGLGAMATETGAPVSQRRTCAADVTRTGCTRCSTGRTRRSARSTCWCMPPASLGRGGLAPLRCRCGTVPAPRQLSPPIEATCPSIFSEAFSWPLLTLDDSALQHDITTMARVCAEHRVAHAPHVKAALSRKLYLAAAYLGLGSHGPPPGGSGCWSSSVSPEGGPVPAPRRKPCSSPGTCTRPACRCSG